MIRLDSITKSYKKKQVLENISIEIADKSLLILVGPNGSGKSTLLKIILGLTTPDTGNISSSQGRATFGYMPEITTFPAELKAKHILALLDPERIYSDSPVCSRIIQEFEMNNFLENKCGQLSKGQGRKLSLLCAFIGNARLIVLDEPFEGLDTIDRDKLMAILRYAVEQGATVICTSHILYDLDHVSDVTVFMKEGKIVAELSKNETGAWVAKSDNSQSLQTGMSEFNGNSEMRSIHELYRSLYQ